MSIFTAVKTSNVASVLFCLQPALYVIKNKHSGKCFIYIQCASIGNYKYNYVYVQQTPLNKTTFYFCISNPHTKKIYKLVFLMVSLFGSGFVILYISHFLQIKNYL
jgi:hypothetical protein